MKYNIGEVYYLKIIEFCVKMIEWRSSFAEKEEKIH